MDAFILKKNCFLFQRKNNKKSQNKREKNWT